MNADTLEKAFPFIIAGLILLPIVGWYIQSQIKAVAQKRAEEQEFNDRQRRLRFLVNKHGDEIGKKLFQQLVWQGETEEQLRDSLGAPMDIDTQVMKSKSREIWKYRQTSANRYALKITLENGVVVGWDSR